MKLPVIESELIAVADAAKILELSPIRVRQLANEGKLHCLRTPGGIRLFTPADVEVLRARRLAEKERG